MRKFLLLLIVALSFVSFPAGISKANTFSFVESPFGSAASPVPVQRRRARRYRRYRGPVRASKAPVGATARCRDGTYSFSRNRRGTCSWHGGVAVWLN